MLWWIGSVLSGLIAAMLLVSGVMKLLGGEEMAKGGDILVTQDFRAALANVQGFKPHGTLFGTQSVFRWQDGQGLQP